MTARAPPVAGVDAQHERVDQCARAVVFSVLGLRAVFYGDLAGLPPEAVLQKEETHLSCTSLNYKSLAFFFCFLFFDLSF